MCKKLNIFKKNKDKKKKANEIKKDPNRLEYEKADLNDSEMRMRNKFRGRGGY